MADIVKSRPSAGVAAGGSSAGGSPADEALAQAWIERYRGSGGPSLEGAEAAAAIKACAAVHFEASGVAAVIARLDGTLGDLVAFLEGEWGWKVTYDEAAGLVQADERKDYCVCPLVRLGFVDSEELCACSEGFAEALFSAALRRPVRAKIARSFLRDGKSCVYEIRLV
jgi:hypothetical protein